MPRRIFAFIAMIALLLVAAGPSARQAAAAAMLSSPSQIIVGDTAGKTTIVPVPYGMSAENLARNYMSRPGAAYAEPDQTAVMTALAPNDAYYSILQKNSFTDMSILDAWDITGGSNKVVIAVLDTGVDPSHPDLKGRVLDGGYNFVSSKEDASDDNGHGTMCAGIIAAGVNNDTGCAGATKSTMILPVKVLDSKGNGQISNIAAGIRYAADHGANIINLSLSCSNSSQTLQDAVDYAFGKGVLIVAASGNTGADVQYPAACDHAIAVGAVTSSNTIATYSNHGSRQALVAVGSGVFSTSLKGGYAVGDGTSFAAPFVSSLAALLLSVNDKYTPDDIKKVMENTATDLGDPGWDQYYGYGCVNFGAALKAAKPANTDKSAAADPDIAHVSAPAAPDASKTSQAPTPGK